MKHILVTRVTYPDALEMDSIVDLFHKAFKHGVPTSPEVALAEFGRVMGHPDLLMLVGWEENVPVALMLATLPSSPLFVYPQVYHSYNRGSVRLRDALHKEMVDWASENGYNGLLIANWTGKGDKVFGRMLKKVGELYRIGSVFALEFKK